MKEIVNDNKVALESVFSDRILFEYFGVVDVGIKCAIEEREEEFDTLYSCPFLEGECVSLYTLIEDLLDTGSKVFGFETKGERDNWLYGEVAKI